MEERKGYEAPKFEVAYFEMEEIMTDSDPSGGVIGLPVVPWNPTGDGK